MYGGVLIFTGRMAEGRQALRFFERLSPHDASIAMAHRWIAISYYFERDYERCVVAARRQLSAHPDYAGTRRWLAAALGQLGRTEEARAALEQVIAQSPGEFDVHARNRVPWMRPKTTNTWSTAYAKPAGRADALPAGVSGASAPWRPRHDPPSSPRATATSVRPGPLGGCERLGWSISARVGRGQVARYDAGPMLPMRACSAQSVRRV